MIGAGTALNVATVLVGSGIGLLLGHRLPQRTRDVVTDGLGLVTLLVAGTSAATVLDSSLSDAVGSSAPMLIVLGAVLVGGVLGTLLRVEDRLRSLGGVLQHRFGGRRAPRGRAHPADDDARPAGDIPAAGGQVRADDAAAAGTATHESRERFVQGFLTASLLFCVGPLTVLGSLSDGLGRGIEQLALKSVLDGFASVAFAASLGVGVMASALSVAVVQGSLTLVGFLLGDVMPDAHVAALTATGGLLLVGVALRLLRIRDIAVGDLLPALVVAPLIVEVVVRAS